MFKSSTTLFVVALFATLAFHKQMPTTTKAQQPQLQIQSQSQTQTPSPASSPASSPALPVLHEYRGVKLGMNRNQVKAAMDKPSNNDKDWDEFKLGDGDLMTVRYDEQNAVKTIQLYFTDSSRAPAWTEAVGSTEFQEQPNGSKVARAVIKEENFWVTMYQNKSGSVTTITISR